MGNQLQQEGVLMDRLYREMLSFNSHSSSRSSMRIKIRTKLNFTIMDKEELVVQIKNEVVQILMRAQ